MWNCVIVRIFKNPLEQRVQVSVRNFVFVCKEKLFRLFFPRSFFLSVVSNKEDCSVVIIQDMLLLRLSAEERKENMGKSQWESVGESWRVELLQLSIASQLLGFY
jgi:hypothetical protein